MVQYALLSALLLREHRAVESLLEATPKWAKATPKWAKATPKWAKATPKWAKATPKWAEPCKGRGQDSACPVQAGRSPVLVSPPAPPPPEVEFVKRSRSGRSDISGMLTASLVLPR